MRVVILPDADFLLRERAMLGRLEVGLADEGVRVIHAVPASVDGIEAAGVYSTTITYLDRGLPFSGPLRIAALMRTLKGTIDEPENAEMPHVDAVYAAGEKSWPIAVELGRRLNAGVLIDVWKTGLASAARQLAAKVSTRSVVRGLSMRFLAPDNPSAALLRRDIPSALVPVVPWGVHPGEIDRPGGAPGGSTLTVALLATGSDGLAVRGALEGLARVAERHPGLVVMVDAAAAERMPLWSWAKSAKMTERLCVISEIEGRRDLVLHADMLMVPEAVGEHRSIVLDALASRTHVVAVRDPMVEWLSEERYAVLTDRADAALFAGAVLALLADGTRAEALRTAGWQEISERRSASAQVRALLGVIDALEPVNTDGGPRTSGGGGGAGGTGS